MPSIDRNAVDTSWGHDPVHELDYSRLPYYLAFKELEYMKTKPLVRKLLGSFPWQENEGTIKARREMDSPSPIVRQMPTPNKMLDGTMPKVDVISTRRFFAEAEPAWQDFHSTQFRWLNSYVEKFPNTIQRLRNNIQDKLMVFDEQYYLTQLWAQCPSVYVAGKGWVDVSPAPDLGYKTAAWVKGQLINGCMEADPVDFIKIASELHDNRGIHFFQGSDYKVDQPISGGTYAMLASTEFQLQQNFNSFLLANRPLAANIVGDTWKESPFGLYSWRTWQKPFRFDQDGNLPSPETVVTGGGFNDGETIPNPAYTKIQSAPYEVIFVLGKNVGDAMTFGPPPSEFTSTGASQQVPFLNWNGKININKLILTTTTDQNGVAMLAINPGGHEARFEARWAGGFVPIQRRAIAAYFFKRKLGT